MSVECMNVTVQKQRHNNTQSPQNHLQPQPRWDDFKTRRQPEFMRLGELCVMTI